MFDFDGLGPSLCSVTLKCYINKEREELQNIIGLNGSGKTKNLEAKNLILLTFPVCCVLTCAYRWWPMLAGAKWLLTSVLG